MTSLNADSNINRTPDRDAAHSDLMREPGTYKDDHKKRRPGFAHIRSFDQDVALLCNICSLQILVWNITRDWNGKQSTRYISALAKKLELHAFQVKKIDHPGFFRALITDLNTKEEWAFNDRIDFNRWVERQYWDHLQKVHGEAESSPPSNYGDL